VLESEALPPRVPPPPQSMASKLISSGQRSAGATPLRWKLTAGGLALAGAAMISATLVLINGTPNLPKRELAVVATEAPISPQSAYAPPPASNAGASMQDRQAEPLQVGAVEAPASPNPSPTNVSPVPAGGKAAADEPHPATQDSGAEAAAPALTPVPDISAAAPAALPIAKPDDTLTATALASTDPALPAEGPQPHANAAPAPFSSIEAPRPATAKIDATKRPPGKTSLQKPKSAKAPAKPGAEAERQPPRPAQAKEADRSLQPAPVAGNPAPLAPAPAPSIQQQAADGVTNAFGYVMRLPSALMPHPSDPGAAAN